MISKVPLAPRSQDVSGSNTVISSVNSYPLGNRWDQQAGWKYATLETPQEFRIPPVLPASQEHGRKHTQHAGAESQELGERASVQPLTCCVLWGPPYASVSKVHSEECRLYQRVSNFHVYVNHLHILLK